MTVIWDKAVLKQQERAAREEALSAQSDDDWEFAVLQLERGKSDLEDGFVDCPLPACRRAKHCVGNPLICTARCELQPGAEQGLVEEFYADLQQERRNAAEQGRPPEVERVLCYVKEDGVENETAPAPVSDKLERNVPVPEAPRSAPPQPAPPQQLHNPEPPAAAPAAPVSPAANLAAAAPPLKTAPEIRSSPEVEERVNAIWAEYVASPAEFTARRRGPRIRLL